MNRPKLKTPKNDVAPRPDLEARPVQLPPLNVSGVVVKKKDLVEALRIYVPLIADIQAFEDGENFCLIVDGQKAQEESTRTSQVGWNNELGSNER